MIEILRIVTIVVGLFAGFSMAILLPIGEIQEAAYKAVMDKGEGSLESKRREMKKAIKKELSINLSFYLCSFLLLFPQLVGMVTIAVSLVSNILTFILDLRRIKQIRVAKDFMHKPTYQYVMILIQLIGVAITVGLLI